MTPIRPLLEIDFLDNTDPDGIDRTLERIGAEEEQLRLKEGHVARDGDRYGAPPAKK